MAEGHFLIRDVATTTPTVITADHPPISSAGAALIAVDIVMLLLATSWTGMRIWVRRYKHLSMFMIEDILCYLSLMCYCGAVTGHIISVVGGGVGHHIKTLSNFHVERYSKLSFFAQIIYGPVVGLVKLSIIFMLRRVFFTKRFRIACYVVMGVAVAWMTMPILVALLVCRPLEFNWNRQLPHGQCGNKTLAYALVGVVDLISDALILALPMRMVYQLRVSRPHKIALAGIFGLGTMCVNYQINLPTAQWKTNQSTFHRTMVFTAIRLYYVYNLDVTDITYTTVVPSIIGSVQMGVAIMVASSPLLRPLFDRAFGNLFGLSLRSIGRTSERTPASKPTSGKELVTFGRLGVKQEFQKMNDSEEHLRGEQAGAK
ncbi:uncharacterized protein CTRU02_212200 [Colletotrichum truncatum]|uniref:Integral membrane protein n=1 Tax=Colletotrichum truncatum TaxID=5467 RepID=A0ACC3YN37_COLTU|nr:uncharacterized protein CTRU02_06729 [Colletotrichum truncatum]KAF6792112.1 integral membrane protein [Colletotrichum truncatum]